MLSILLLDESVSIKRALEIGLQDWNPEIQALSSKVNAKEAVKQHKPHLVFIDVLTPGRNGYNLCREMKTDNELKVFPVVLLFSHFAPLDQTLFAQSGANASLEKPFRSETLRQCIKPLLPQDQQHPLQPYLEMPDMGPGMEASTLAPPDHYRLDPSFLKQEGGLQSLEDEMLKKSTPSFSDHPLSPHQVKTFSPTVDPMEGQTSHPPTPEEKNLNFEMAPMGSVQQKISPFAPSPPSPSPTSPPNPLQIEDILEGLSSPQANKAKDFPPSPLSPPSPESRGLSPQELKTLCYEQLQTFLASEAFLSLVRERVTEEVQKIFSRTPGKEKMEQTLQTAIEKALWQALPDKMESMIRDRLDALIQDV